MSTPRTIWIARHGERLDFVKDGWFTSAENPYDPPLSPAGRKQAEELAGRLSGEAIDHLFASPFLRTLETAQPVARSLDLPIKMEYGIGEQLHTEWFAHDPRRWSRLDRYQKFPRIDKDYRSRIEPCYPEDWDTCRRRAGRAMQLIAEQHEGNLLMIGHGITVMSMIWGLTGIKPTLNSGFCSLVELRQVDGQWRVHGNADQSFLSYIEPEIKFALETVPHLVGHRPPR